MSGGLRMSLADLALTRAWADPRNRERVAEAAGIPPHPQAANTPSPGLGGPCSRRVEHSEPPGVPKGGRPRRGGAPQGCASAIIPRQEGDTAPPVAAFVLARGHESTPLACIEFTVSVQPRGWQRDTPLGYGRSVKTQAEAAYQRDIARFARQARAALGGMPLIRGGVRLSVVAYLAVPKSYGKGKRADCLAGRILPACKPDADNALKSVMDALTGVLWVDDKQCVAVSCLKVWAETGSLYVRVQAL